MDDAMAAARRMWALFEPVHVVTYFTPEGRAAFEEAGLRGFWRGYFAGRAAPLSPTGAAPVIASFFVFAPAMVKHAIPAVFDLASPPTVLQARQAGAIAAIRRLLGLQPGSAVPAGVRAAADELMTAASDLDQAGRLLAAANIALPVPEEPLARLWHAATLLREHRGDGHVAALVAACLDGAEALALRIGIDQAGDGSYVAASWGRDQISPPAAGLTRSGMPRPPAWPPAACSITTARRLRPGSRCTGKSSSPPTGPPPGRGRSSAAGARPGWPRR